MEQDTEGKILEAAKKIFVQKGFAGARMQEIADAAKINKAMLHYYYRSKQLLFERILKNHVDIMAPKLIEALSYNGSVIEKFEKLVDSYIDTMLPNPKIPMFLLHEMAQGHVSTIEYMKKKMADDEIMQNLILQIIAEQQSEKLRDIPPHHMILTVMSLIIFPFIAKPVFQNMLDIPEKEYLNIMSERKEIVKDFIRRSVLK
ncbi:MAG: TetR/AcrR family transcriptional regulator [Saonia sp.]